MKKILFVVNSPLAFLQSRISVAESLRSDGFLVEVATPDQPEVAEIRRLGYKVHVVPLGRGSINPVSNLATVAALSRVYKTAAPDLVHHVAWKSIINGGLAVRWSRVPAIVNTVAGLGYAFSSDRLRPRAIRFVIGSLLRRIARHPNIRFIAQNPDDERLLVESLGLPRSAVVLIRGSGVDLERFSVQPEKSGAPCIVLPSRLLWSKGVGEFIAAARMLKSEGAVARFALVGEPDPQNPDSISQAVLNEWAKEGVVEVWGWRSDMTKVFQEAHIVTLPSKYREGIPRVLLEAAASGRPIVTTDAPGCREPVIQGKTGLLVEPGSADALAAALRSLISDSKSRQAMGQAGRQFMERTFSTAAVVGQTRAVYQELLDRTDPTAGA